MPHSLSVRQQLSDIQLKKLYIYRATTEATESSLADQKICNIVMEQKKLVLNSEKAKRQKQSKVGPHVMTKVNKWETFFHDTYT